MTDTTVTVTIGRNVGPDPLPADRWHTFAFRTREAVESATTELWAVAPYRGSWDGVSEDARIYYGPARSAAAIEVLRQRLAVLASYYGQDAIGLSVGTAELVESFTSRYAALAPAVAEDSGL